MHANTSLASSIANGAPGPLTPSPAPASGGLLSSLTGALSALSQGMSSASDLTDSVKWIVQNEKSFKYGTVDVSKIAAAGQSCKYRHCKELGLHHRYRGKYSFLETMLTRLQVVESKVYN
jgi:hypothetical protein